MNNEPGTVPGFSSEQTWALKQLMKAAVTEGIGECDRLSNLETSVYGNGGRGLKVDVVELKKDVGSLIWWYRLLVAGLVTSWVAILIAYVTT